MSSSTPIKTFIGREREIATLRATLDTVQAGESRTVVVSGAPGIGKTWLVRALADIAAERGVYVLWGRCHPEPGAPPYWPWTQMLRRLAGHLNE